MLAQEEQPWSELPEISDLELHSIQTVLYLQFLYWLPQWILVPRPNFLSLKRPLCCALFFILKRKNYL
jgi:hypothetical protein